MDGNVRRLVGKHIHLRPTWAGRYQYEFPECNDSTKNTSSGVKSSYKLNTKVFDLYKSASIHTKQNKKIPAAVYAVIALFFIIGFLGFRLSDRFGSSVPVAAVEQQQKKITPTLVKPRQQKKEQVAFKSPVLIFLDKLIKDYRPRLSGYVVRSGFSPISGYIEFYLADKLVESFSFQELKAFGVAVVKKRYGVDIVTASKAYPVSSWRLPEQKFKKHNTKNQRVALND